MRFAIDLTLRPWSAGCSNFIADARFRWTVLKWTNQMIAKVSHQHIANCWSSLGLPRFLDGSCNLLATLRERATEARRCCRIQVNLPRHRQSKKAEHILLIPICSTEPAAICYFCLT
jgi:hypothetical protein